MIPSFHHVASTSNVQSSPCFQPDVMSHVISCSCYVHRPMSCHIKFMLSHFAPHPERSSIVPSFLVALCHQALQLRLLQQALAAPRPGKKRTRRQRQQDNNKRPLGFPAWWTWPQRIEGETAQQWKSCDVHVTHIDM